MKDTKRYARSLLVAIVGMALAGCSGIEKQKRAYVDETWVTVAKAEYPQGYQFSESWHGTEWGGAALRHPAYEHSLVSPYAVHDLSGTRYVARDAYTQVLLTSVSRTQYANGPRGTFIQAPRFCDENSFLLPNNKQNASRTEYLQIKERYCSTPGYRLSQHEIDVLTKGEPEELRQYRIKMHVDNQTTKFN
ncbi:MULTISPECIES: hypothetical protein [Photorhabdus]|uniref:Lipoprotein n=2 Tax=Photorhabdus TaxID=29487 RepID=A0AAW6BPQ2_9GAMM|nr:MULTISPECIES: hypothetical protein [Photorhabdus]EYU15098.1 hypothetical protein BA1DRAFT_02368 [Photorhabdus aegyptia]MDB6373942.1 hypothetical protein [Photorhabdus bodei]